MIWIIISIILAVIIGYLIGKWLTSKQKFGDREAVLKAEWGKKIANLEKDYEIKLEKSKSAIEKEIEENKTKIEKLTKEWQVKYIKDIEELKRLFKDSEKKIKQKSVSSSRRSLVGKFIERFVPFLSKIPYAPSDMHFLGQPIDYIVFEGLKDDDIKKVGFIEVKTGESKLNKREKSLKEVIDKKKVYWKEVRVDTKEKKTPDKKIEVEDTSINELYDTIDDKISSIKNKAPNIEKSLEEDDEDDEDDDWVCKHCKGKFELDEETEDEIYNEGGKKIKCPHCNKMTLCEYEDEEEDEDEDKT